MLVIISATVFIIVLYHLYPVWLMMSSPQNVKDELETETIDSVSVILLSYNGKKFIERKIDILLRELAAFRFSELIVIDDNSTDGSKELLAGLKHPENVRIIVKDKQQGIPHTMNTGIALAKYDFVIFCDQRQNLCCDILQKIVEPLRYKHIGAVSACISHFDKGNCNSLIRRFENFIKTRESKLGSLIGVYGPFYAIKKAYYPGIPENIILDDLYLSLKIMQSSQVRILEDCRIFDDNLSVTHGFERSKRYLKGFLQILNQKSLISNLSARQKVMLIWHKYLRLLIPVFLFISYAGLGFMGLQNYNYLLIFGVLTLLGLVAVFQNFFRVNFMLKNFLRINIMYILAMGDILIREILLGRFFSANQPKEVTGVNPARL